MYKYIFLNSYFIILTILRGTLDGIYKNIEIFKNSAGVGYQDVAVVVVFDGYFIYFILN